MPTPVKWSNVQVSIQTALGVEKTITAITKADPAAVSAAAHGYAAGDYVVLDTEGMYQVDARVFRAGAIDAGSYSLEGEDSTLYDTFVSGRSASITFGINMSTVVSLQASGGDFDFIDITTIHDNIRKQIPGLASAAVYTFENIWDAADPGLIALKQASDNQGLRAIRFTFSAGQLVLFNAYVGCTLLPVGEAQNLVKTNTVLTMFGRPTTYAS